MNNSLCSILQMAATVNIGYPVSDYETRRLHNVGPGRKLGKALMQSSLIAVKYKQLSCITSRSQTYSNFSPGHDLPASAADRSRWQRL